MSATQQDKAAPVITMAPAEFLTQIFGPDPEGCITVSHLDRAKARKDGSAPLVSVHTKTPTEAAAVALKLAPEHDVWVSVCPRREGLTPGQRGGKDDVVALTAFIADLDIAGPNHQTNGKVYFADQADLLAFVDSLPLKPSFVVWTGGGAHLWWLLREPWVFTDAAERDAADRALKGWGVYLRAKGQENGVDIDPVQELARVLRVPGTVNHKGGGQVQVEVIRNTGLRYNVGDFAELAPPTEADKTDAPAATFTFNPTATRSAEVDALILNDALAAAAWEGRKPKFPSASEADLGFANYCVAAGFSDQKMADAIVARRLEQGEGFHKKMGDYLTRTIKKARAGHMTPIDEPRVNDHPEGCHCSECVEARQSPKEKLSAKLGLSVARIVKRGRVGGTFELVLADGGAVIFGGADALLSFPKCRAAVLDAAAIVLPAALRNAWPDVAAFVARVAEVIELPSEGEEVIGWLTAYVVNRSPGQRCNTLERFLEDDGSSGLSEFPRVLVIEEDGRDVYYFNLRPLIQIINHGERVPTTTKSLGARLSRVGCTPRLLSQRVAGRPSPIKRRAWRWCPSENAHA